MVGLEGNKEEVLSSIVAKIRMDDYILYSKGEVGASLSNRPILIKEELRHFINNSIFI